MEKTRLIDEIKKIIKKTRLETASLFCMSNKKLYLVLDIETFHKLKTEYLKDLQDKRINCQIQSEDLDILGVTVCPGEIANKRKKSYNDDDEFVYQFCIAHPRDLAYSKYLELFSISKCNNFIEYNVFSESLEDLLEKKIYFHNVPYFKKKNIVACILQKLFLLHDLTIKTESFTTIKQFILYPFINLASNNNQEKVEIYQDPTLLKTESSIRDESFPIFTLTLNRKKFRYNMLLEVDVKEAKEMSFYMIEKYALQMEKEIINLENNITRKEDCIVEIPESKKDLFLFRLKKIFPFLCSYRIFNHKKRIYNFKIEINVNISNKNINQFINKYTTDHLVSAQRFYYSEHHETHTLSKAS